MEVAKTTVLAVKKVEGILQVLSIVLHQRTSETEQDLAQGHQSLTGIQKTSLLNYPTLKLKEETYSYLRTVK